jgi:hypothetical protein
MHHGVTPRDLPVITSDSYIKFHFRLRLKLRPHQPFVWAVLSHVKQTLALKMSFADGIKAKSGRLQRVVQRGTH